VKRREFLSKIGAVLATASTAATLAKAGDVKSWKDKQPPSRIQSQVRGVYGRVVWADDANVGRVTNLQVLPQFRKITYRVTFKDGRVEYRTAYEKFGKYVIDPFDHRKNPRY